MIVNLSESDLEMVTGGGRFSNAKENAHNTKEAFYQKMREEGANKFESKIYSNGLGATIYADSLIHNRAPMSPDQAKALAQKSFT